MTSACFRKNGFVKGGRMSRESSTRAVLAACGLLALLVVAPVAQAASVAPRLVLDNPSCEELGYAFLVKFEGSDLPGNGESETLAGITVSRTGEGSINWSSTVAVDAVIVKGGPDANVYDYPLDT